MAEANQPATYLGASSKHLRCDNYKFEPAKPLKIFQRDELCKDVTWIDISQGSGILDQMTFKNLPNLEIISLDKCTISKIEGKTFSALPNLMSINVRKSSFPLDQSTFEHCHKLDNIRFIQVENIIRIPRIFKDLKNLEYLMIDHVTGVKLCNDTFIGLEKLQYLFLRNSLIEEFSANVFQPLANLETLYFSGNRLEQFNPESFLSLKNLTILGFYDNVATSPENLQIDYNMFGNLDNLNNISFPEKIIRTLKFRNFKNVKTVQLVIGKTSNDITEFLKSKNISVQWTTDEDLTQDEDLTNPNIQICA